MPTGYTADILDGKVTTAQEFAAKCARAFMINMRDKGWDAPLEANERYDLRYSDDLAKGVVELQRWDAMTEEQRYAKWSEYAIEAEQRAVNREKEAASNRAKLVEVLAQVEETNIPESLAEFRKFMVDQIESTIDFDGTFNREYYAVTPYGEWVDAQRSHILRMLEIYVTDLKRAEENYQKGRAWLNDLSKTFGLKIEGL